MRSAAGIKSAVLSFVTRVTKSTIAFLVEPSFQDGSGSEGGATDCSATFGWPQPTAMISARRQIGIFMLEKETNVHDIPVTDRARIHPAIAVYLLIRKNEVHARKFLCQRLLQCVPQLRSLLVRNVAFELRLVVVEADTRSDHDEVQ